MTTYADKRARLGAELAAAGRDGVAGFRKRTSNLFRDRAPKQRPRIDLASFDDVIRIDTAAGTFRLRAEKIAPSNGSASTFSPAMIRNVVR